MAEEQTQSLNENYTMLIQKIRQTTMMAFGGALNTGARKKTVRTAFEASGLAEQGFYEYRGVQADGSYSNSKNMIPGNPKAFNSKKAFRLVDKEDLNRIYPSAGGGWFGMESLPDELAELVPPMGFRDLNALTQVSFGPLKLGAKGKSGKSTVNTSIPHVNWPTQLDSRAVPSYERPADGRIPLGYLDDNNTVVPIFARDRDQLDAIIDGYLDYFYDLGYVSLRNYDLRSYAKNKQVWETVKVVGAVVQVIGTLMKLIPIPPVQAVGTALEIAGQVTVFVAGAALQGDLFSSSDAADLLSDAAYVSIQAYSLLVTEVPEFEPDEPEVKAVLDDLTAAADAYGESGDPSEWLAVFPDDVQAAAASWLECLSPNPQISNRNANAILLGTGSFQQSGSKQDSIPYSGELGEQARFLAGFADDGIPIPLPALGPFALPAGEQLSAINSAFASPKASAPDGALLIGLAAVGGLVYYMGR